MSFVSQLLSVKEVVATSIVKASEPATASGEQFYMYQSTAALGKQYAKPIQSASLEDDYWTANKSEAEIFEAHFGSFRSPETNNMGFFSWIPCQ